MMTMDNSSPVVGSDVRIELSNGDELIGEVYTVDPVTGSLVIRSLLSGETSQYEINIVPRNAANKIEVRKEGSAIFDQLPSLNTNTLEEIELKALEEASARLESVNINATAEAQKLFDALSKTLPCQWEGTSIQVLQQVRIDPPYDPADCHSLDGSNDSLNRIMKVVEGIRQKLLVK